MQSGAAGLLRSSRAPARFLVRSHGQVTLWNSGTSCMAGTSIYFGRESIVRRLQASVQRSGVIMVHFAPPCTTFSQARRPALRTRAHPAGLPTLATQHATQVHQANRLVAVTASVCLSLAALGVPFCIQTPQTSLFWHMPSIRRLLECEDVCTFRADMCQFGAPWRKFEVHDFGSLRMLRVARDVAQVHRR